MSNVHRTIIVPSGMVNAARQLGTEIATGGHGMYMTGLSPTGNPPATHYVSSGMIGAEFAGILNDGLMLHAAAAAGAARQNIPKVATEKQAKDLPPVATVHAGKHIDVDGNEIDEGPHELFARIGLKIVQETLP